MKQNILVFLITLFSINAVSQIAPDTYIIKFKDKKNIDYNIDKPEEFLSERAILRRQNYNIPITKQDLPVDKKYIKDLKKMGFEIYAVSKWFNLAVVYTKNKELLEEAYNLPFVEKDYKTGYVEKKSKKRKRARRIRIRTEQDTSLAFDYGRGENQIKMLNGHYLHNRGWTGEGIQIALMDAGFYKVNSLPSFDSLHANKQIIGVRDFVERDGDVYKDDTHGMQVLSTIGANCPGKLVGTAPKAKFWLLRTEDSKSEYIVEEYYWINAAEFADSVGVDMIHTSLGYNDFDDKINSHTYKEMNGNSAPVSIGADIASSKGILVVTSAGNEGNDPWKYMSAPADADSVLAVGSVNSLGKVSNFSSRGPSSDNRVKPEVMAKGFFAAVQGRRKKMTTSSGTSFSGPIMAGAVACLWQANPEFNNMEIIDAVIKSCNKYRKPNDDYGYGIPDFAKADKYLKKIKSKK